MKRRFQGLASTMKAEAEIADGVFLVRIDQVRYSKERQKPFYALRFSVLEPTPWVGRAFSARLCCTPKALWKFSWFLRDFGYDTELFGRDEIDDKGPDRAAWSGEVVQLRRQWPACHQPGCLCNGRSLGFDRFAQPIAGGLVTFSYTQIAQYLACPLRYRYRYLDGWQEKETRAGLLFGRAFEQALAALFRREDPGCALFEAWSQYKNSPLEYPKSETWDQMLEQGIHLLARFVQDDRVQIRNPRRNLQIKFTRPIGNGNEFIAYVDAIGQLDGERSVIDWKTTGARYPDQPEGLLALDPQLVCYSWITGEPNVGFVVFVRKRLVEVQYLRATITQEQRDRFGEMIAGTIRQIEAAQFPARSGIRFPQNGCLSCSHLGLCLGKQDMVDTRLIRRPGGDLGWLDQLDF